MNEWQQKNMEKIVIKHSRRMYYEAYAILHDAQLAEDAVQEAFFNALKFPEKIFAADCPKTHRYFVVIMKRVALNIYNKRKREAFYVDPQEDLLYLHIEDVSQKVDHLAYEELLAQIPTELRDLLWLLSRGFTQKEIAELTGENYDTVRKRIQRARVSLSKQLDGWKE